MNRFEEALECYDKAIKKDPKNSEYYFGKGIKKTFTNFS